MEVRTRFAPSPTGFMHIGGVRTALYAYLIAKKNDGKFILRIEDTDQSRYVEGAVDVIYDSLRELGLIWDEGPDVGGDYGPYIQSERKGNYLDYAKKLVKEDKAYYCFCDKERLDNLKEELDKKGEQFRYDAHCRNIPLEEAEKRVENGESYVVRFKMPTEGTTVFEDKIYGEISVDNKEMEDLILIKSDLMPTYNFANIIDDHEMKISHIIRGNEYVSSTPKYVQIYNALGWDVPEFVHLPIIKKSAESDKKLSKRDNDATVASLKAQGYLNKAIINMLALTGWSPGGEEELFTLEELVETFNVEGIGKGNAIFAVDKLKWMNSVYLKNLELDEYREFIMPFISDNFDISEKNQEWLDNLILLFQDRIQNGEEIIPLVNQFFNDEFVITDDAKEFMQQEGISNTIEVFKGEVEKIEDFTPENINDAIKSTKKLSGAKGKMLFMPVRIATTGDMHGPDLTKSISLLGKETILKRLNETGW